MTDLSTYIYDVRREISDMPEDYIEDIQAYQCIEQAYALLTKIVDDVTKVDEDYLKHCIVILASYYAYVNYSSLAEKRLGQIPTAMSIKVNEMKKKAHTFISYISSGSIDSNFNLSIIDSTPTVLGLTTSIGDIDL